LACICLPLAAQIKFRPEDMFRVRRPGPVTWSPDSRYAAIELSRPAPTLGGIPSAEIALIDVKTQTIKPISSSAPSYLGFFNATWSPSGRRLAFLSVDANGVVRGWTWQPGAQTAAAIGALDAHVGFLDSPIVWIDDDRLAITAWEPGAKKYGSFYVPIFKGRNVAEGWKQAIDGKGPTVSALRSGGVAGATSEPKDMRLWAIDLRTRTKTPLGQGEFNRLRASPDGRFISFLRGSSLRSAEPYFEANDVDAAYDAVNWGKERHVIDSRTGEEVPASSMPETTRPPATAPPTIAPPRSDARRLSVAPAGNAALFVANASDGTHLWLAGPAVPEPKDLWRANEWAKDIALGKSEPIPYKSSDGTPLTAWLLLPPGDTPPAKLPMITMVYPGTTFGANTPAALSIFTSDFEHPQLFAALGYAVLKVSMPEPKAASEALWASHFAEGVLPAVDAAIARGIADPDRIAILGQSNGGYVTLSLIAQSKRFRSAIASGAPTNFASIYGTFYGAYRSGDSGDPRIGQLLRMLQLEKGVYQFGASPSLAPDLYRANSPITHVGQVETPVMLIEGNLDFIPIEQGEEYFTALYRRGERAEFVRYQGEGHSISNRENVLDLWKRMEAWLAETMPPRKQQ
jgi:dipeptidyl aminopeptidase/acylaminoacyl peptidase